MRSFRLGRNRIRPTGNLMIAGGVENIGTPSSFRAVRGNECCTDCLHVRPKSHLDWRTMCLRRMSEKNLHTTKPRDTIGDIDSGALSRTSARTSSCPYKSQHESASYYLSYCRASTNGHAALQSVPRDLRSRLGQEKVSPMPSCGRLKARAPGSNLLFLYRHGWTRVMLPISNITGEKDRTTENTVRVGQKTK